MAIVIAHAKQIMLANNMTSQFLISDLEESLSSLSTKLLEAHNQIWNNSIHLLVTSNSQYKFLNANQRNRNAEYALSASILRLSSEKKRFSGGYWSITEISSKSVLISIGVDPKHSIERDDVLGILQSAITKNFFLNPSINIPTPEEFVSQLKALRGDAYLNKVLRDLHGILDFLSTSVKRQMKEIDGVVFVLNFLKSMDLINQNLARYLEKCSEIFQAKTSSSDVGLIGRRIDAAFYVLFELTEKSAIQSFASTSYPILKELHRRGVEVPFLSRAFRQSFLKGIDFLTAQPSLIDLIKKTDTDDARGFLVIYHLLTRSRGLSDSFQDAFLFNNLKNISTKGLALLAKDLRRRVPITSSRPFITLADSIAWLCTPDGSNDNRKTSLSKCMLLHQFNSLRPGLILWMYRNECKIGLEKDDVHMLSALTGYDVPYVFNINKCMFNSLISVGLASPSKCSNIIEYFKLNLETWKKFICSRQVSAETAELPLVSVIFTTYEPNIELFKISIESILHQSYKNIEIIIIDDGSNFATSRMLEALVDSISQLYSLKIIYQRNKKNVGQYVSRNTAIEIAKGDFVAIQDDDDISHPERLHFQIAPLLKNPEIVATHAQHLRISNNARIMRDGDELSEIQGDAPVSFIWRKQVFQEIGLFLPTKTRGDIEFRTRMRQHYGNTAILTLKQPLVLVRGGMGTVSSDKEYYYRSALFALRYMMTHIPSGVNDMEETKRWIPTLLQ